MLSRSKISSNKRFLKVSAVVVFALCIAFYAFPIFPTPFSKSAAASTSITADEIVFLTEHPYLSSSEAADFCSSHNVPQFEERSSAHSRGGRKVYDLFMLNTELDWLEIRLNELGSQVDYFVILEAPTTFTGLPKQMYYLDNKDKFKAFEKKIIHHVLEPPEEGHPGHVANNTYEAGTPEYEAHAWTMERFQRNAMFSQVLPFLKDSAEPHEDDVIIVSDIDEIPRPETVRLLRDCHFGRLVTLRSKFYYYSFQWLHRGVEWAHPQATTYHGPSRTVLPASLREMDGSAAGVPVEEKQIIWNSAWHCSSCFETLAEMLLKMKSFSHTNLNAEKFRSKDRIVDHIRNGKDLWDRWFQYYKRVENNQDVPVYLKEQAKKGRFEYMLNRDGESAGFVDYDIIEA